MSRNPFFISFCLLLLISAQSVRAEMVEKIHAVVNGEIITLTEIAEYQTKLKTGGFLNDLLFSEAEDRERALKDRDFLIQMMVYEKLMDYEIKQQSLQVTEERVTKEISTIAKRQGMTVKQLEQVLSSQGVDILEYRNFVKKSIERRQLVEKEITSKIKISEQDIVSHYLATAEGKKSQTFEYSLSHILLDNSALAGKVRSELSNGKSFESLVTEYSQDQDSRENAGNFGRFKTGEMIAAIESAISSLEIGGVSSIVQTPMGFHIFKVVDKKLVNDPQMEKQKQAIYQELFAREFREQLEFWLMQKQKDAIVQNN